MRITNADFIEEVRYIIRITKESKTNTEVNILKKINKKTRVSKSELKELFDKYTGKYWTVEQLEEGRTIIHISSGQRLKAYLHEDDEIEGKYHDEPK